MITLNLTQQWHSWQLFVWMFFLGVSRLKGLTTKQFGCQHFYELRVGAVSSSMWLHGRWCRIGHSFLSWSHWIFWPKIAPRRVYRGLLPAFPNRSVQHTVQQKAQMQVQMRRTTQDKRGGYRTEWRKGFERTLQSEKKQELLQLDLKRISGEWTNKKDSKQRILRFCWIGFALLNFSWPSSWADRIGGGQSETSAGMKYNYHAPVSTYTRNSQYTPTYNTATYHTPSHYTPSHYTSSYTSAIKYTPTQYSTTHYTPSHYTSSYKSASTYIPSYSKGARYSSTHRTQAQEKPAPVIPVAPARRTVHFSNDIIFQDIVRHGDLEQIGRFMRARKVRVDTVFHSGEQRLHNFYFLIWLCMSVSFSCWGSKNSCKQLQRSDGVCFSRYGSDTWGSADREPGGGEAAGEIWRRCPSERRGWLDATSHGL